MAFIRTNVLAFAAGMGIVGGYGAFALKKQTDATAAQLLSAAESVEEQAMKMNAFLATMELVEAEVGRLGDEVAAMKRKVAASESSAAKRLDGVESKVADVQKAVNYLKTDMLTYVPGIRVSSAAAQ